MHSASKPERWVICPVCDKPNSAGTRFCEYCWGAAIRQDNTLTTEELEIELKRMDDRAKLRRKIKFGIVGAAALSLIGIIIFSLFWCTDTIFKPSEAMNSNPPPGEWTMFRRDLSHSASSGLDIPEGNLKWVFSTDGAVHSSPAVVDGIVYFGSRDYNLYAVDTGSGSEIWKYKTGSWVESSPAVTGGRVFCGSNDSNFYAFNAQTGEKIWEFETDFPVRSSPAVADERVFFGSDDYYFYSLDTETGGLCWKYDNKGPAYTSPVIDNGILYIGSGTGYSYALNAMTGQRRLRYMINYPIDASPALSDGIVYFATTNGVLSAVDGKARTVFREHEIRHYWVQVWAAGVPLVPEPPPQSGFIWTRSIGGFVVSSPVVKDGVMYIGSGDQLIALNVETREIIWKFKTGGDVRSSPALVGSVVFVGSEDGKLYAVDADTGEKLWDFQTGGKINSSPAVVDGVVYVGSYDGNLYAIE